MPKWSYQNTVMRSNRSPVMAANTDDHETKLLMKNFDSDSGLVFKALVMVLYNYISVCLFISWMRFWYLVQSENGTASLNVIRSFHDPINAS